jgi:dTDP-4-dehydrorhamnose 3,5-epimerase
MIFTETPLKGAFVIEPEIVEDERGFFARTFCREEFAARGLNPNLVQCSISFNRMKHTLRGLHYQVEPYAEDKLVRCTMGVIYDVIVDLRRDSPTYLQWKGMELSAENRRMLFIPKGFAHGFKTLCKNAEVLYQMSQFYNSDAAQGIRWNDPALAINWPSGEPILSDRDRNYADL